MAEWLMQWFSYNFLCSLCITSLFLHRINKLLVSDEVFYTKKHHDDKIVKRLILQ